MHKIEIISLKTSRREELIDITAKIQNTLNNNFENFSGIVVVSSLHTTAGITINENADPDVKSDIIKKLKKMIPQNENYAHFEGNSDAHIKTSLIGNSVQIPIWDNKLVLGTWQGVFFCEFDGPRTRKVHLSFIGE